MKELRIIQSAIHYLSYVVELHIHSGISFQQFDEDKIKNNTRFLTLQVI